MEALLKEKMNRTFEWNRIFLSINPGFFIDLFIMDIVTLIHGSMADTNGKIQRN